MMMRNNNNNNNNNYANQNSVENDQFADDYLYDQIEVELYILGFCFLFSSYSRHLQLVNINSNKTALVKNNIQYNIYI